MTYLSPNRRRRISNIIKLAACKFNTIIVFPLTARTSGFRSDERRTNKYAVTIAPTNVVARVSIMKIII